MKYFSEQFLEAEKDIIEYKGKTIHRFFKFDKKGEYIFKFSFESTNSKYLQAIAIFYGGFEGKIFLDSEEISKTKNSFSHFVFYENSTPKEFNLKIQISDGFLIICNGSREREDDPCRTLVWGCAMVIEEINENQFKFYCNDHENDDDFNDLIFNLNITKTEE